MRLLLFKNTILILSLAFFSCGSTQTETNEGDDGALNDIIQVGEAITADAQRDKDRAKKKTSTEMEVGSLEEVGKPNNTVITGAEQPGLYFPMLRNKRVGVVANQTSVIIEKLTTFDEGQAEKQKTIKTHIVDYMRDNSLNITKVFAPEHGFRGTADAGEEVKDGIDTKTGLPIISLYGNNKKPSKAQLDGIDILVFDIQDVGARFYTYISTLHYVMEACAEQGIPLLILDRPNPNSHYIDGPILEPQHKSFVGMHPVPVVHGMTIGEYAQMINGEKWLANGITCDITIIKNEGYTRKTPYSLPVNPSPNLPNDVAISLYPSLCFFEGTLVSAGRGTEMQFQIFGAPSLPQRFYNFTFTPQSNIGAKNPKFKGEICYGKDLRNYPQMESLNLDWLIEAYVANGKKKDFFHPFFHETCGYRKITTTN